MNEKRSMKEWIARSVILMVGLVIAHLGVTLFLLSDLGSDPFNVLVQGIFRTLSEKTSWGFLTHGRVHMAISLLIIFILLLTDRSYVKIGTVLCMVCGGPIIDFFSMILTPLFANITSMPVIALTANVVSGAREMFLEAGFDDFLAKPISIDRMERILRKYLRRELIVPKHAAGGKYK